MDDSQNYALIAADCIPQRDTETDHTEWFEDAASEAEWADGLDSSTVCSLSESVHSMTLLEELYEKNKVLEKEWREAEQKYQCLKVENQKLTVQLSNERHKSAKIQKKLQYIQDNQEVFNRLKQAYLNMKYNEATGRAMVEIRERACQTWDGILCEACIETAEMKRQTNWESLRGLSGESSTVTVKKTDLAKLQETVQTLKSMIDQREKSWSLNAEKESKYKATIAALQTNIQILNSLLAANHNNQAAPLEFVEGASDMMQQENALLRKIIIKLEKRNRDVEKMYKTEKQAALLSDHEKDMVQQLIQKYSAKLQKTSRSLSLGPLPTNRNMRVQGSRSKRPASTSRSSRGDAKVEGNVTNVPPLKLCYQSNYTDVPEKPFSGRKKKAASEHANVSLFNK